MKSFRIAFRVLWVVGALIALFLILLPHSPISTFHSEIILIIFAAGLILFEVFSSKSPGGMAGKYAVAMTAAFGLSILVIMFLSIAGPEIYREYHRHKRYESKTKRAVLIEDRPFVTANGNLIGVVVTIRFELPASETLFTEQRKAPMRLDQSPVEGRVVSLGYYPLQKLDFDLPWAMSNTNGALDSARENDNREITAFYVPEYLKLRKRRICVDVIFPPTMLKVPELLKGADNPFAVRYSTRIDGRTFNTQNNYDSKKMYQGLLAEGVEKCG